MHRVKYDSYSKESCSEGLRNKYQQGTILLDLLQRSEIHFDMGCRLQMRPDSRISSPRATQPLDRRPSPSSTNTRSSRYPSSLYTNVLGSSRLLNQNHEKSRQIFFNFSYYRYFAMPVCNFIGLTNRYIF